MWLPASHPNFPWTGVLFGAPILGLSAPQPPSSERPSRVTSTAPPTSTNICTMSV